MISRRSGRRSRARRLAPSVAVSIAGPALRFAAGRDDIASSSSNVQAIVRRARAHGRADVVARVYGKAGHGVGCVPANIPFVGHETFPVAPRVGVAIGGTPDADAAAAENAWPLVLRFLGRLRP